MVSEKKSQCHKLILASENRKEQDYVFASARVATMKWGKGRPEGNKNDYLERHGQGGVRRPYI